MLRLCAGSGGGCQQQATSAHVIMLAFLQQFVDNLATVVTFMPYRERLSLWKGDQLSLRATQGCSLIMSSLSWV